MKNIVIFIGLAILTVAALVAWTTLRSNPQSVVTAPKVPTPSQATREQKDSLGRDPQSAIRGSLGGVSTSSASFDTTKGNVDPKGAVVPTSTPVAVLGIGATQAPVNPTQSLTLTQQAGNVVVYSDSGFNPKTFTVRSGTMVKFVNQSSKRMNIQSKNVLNGSVLDGFTMGVDVGKDGSFEYQFTTSGTFGYINAQKSDDAGVIVVN